MAEEDDPRSQENENADESDQNGGYGEDNGRGGPSVVDELTSAVREAAMEILGPAARQATSSAAKYAVKKGPEMMAKNVMPAVRERGGPGEILKQATGGEGGGGVIGMAGKALSKVTGGGGGGKGGGATGFGQGRRIMVQQVQYIPVNVKDAYRAWTESEWPEYMHRVNTLDRQIEDDSASYAIGVKGLWFQKNFTAEVQEQVPFKFIAWRTTQGDIKNTGRVSFIEQGEGLTLMILNLDMAPSGLREKMVRGFRYHKRGIRSDFHRFAAWVQMRTQDELDEMEGWLGTIEGGEITQSHEEYVEEHEEEQNRGQDSEEDEGEGEEEPEGEYEGEPEGEGEEEPEGEQPEGEEEPEGEAEEEPEGEGEEEPEGEGEEEPEGEGEEEPEAEAEEEPEAEAEEEPEEQPRPRRRRASAAQQQESQEGSSRRRRSSTSARASSGGSRSGGGRSSRSSRS
ncbi:MAG TPA: hypothetical protein VE219_03740 [Candidatus Sulfotelmatobacter sp.]|nr:hypothetical protein [Candidatus Sulfotelmatobacter sp.]